MVHFFFVLTHRHDCASFKEWALSTWNHLSEYEYEGCYSMKLFEPTQNKVLVIGDVMLDKYWHGSTDRISPEAPVPVVKVKDVDSRAGGAANVALNIAALHVSAQLAGLVGDDSESEELSNLLKRHSVESLLTCSVDAPTISKLRIMSRHQQLLRLDQEEKFTRQDASNVQETVKPYLSSTSVVVLSDYAKGTLQDTESLITLARENNCQVLVDPKGTDFKKYRGATLLTPNMAEFEAVVGSCANEDQVVERAFQLIREVRLDALLLTRSEKGMTLFVAEQEPVYFATNAQAVFDVTGAGDTVIATLASGLAAGLDLASAVEIANIAAGIAVSKLGTDTVSLAELNSAIEKYAGLEDKKVVSERELLSLIERARKSGQRVVFTNGCFDILHPGHVSYLNEARKLGDRLVVAVNSDASVARLKGPSRPINNLEHRMHVLGGLASVDWVVSFEEDTPARIIGELAPDVLVKGGDYKLQDIAGADTVISRGGEVKVLNFEDGYSTTGIINAAHQSSLKS